MTAEVTLIRPQRGWLGFHLYDLIAYRDLLWVLAGRDVKVRYKQTLLGAAWAVLQPLTAMVIFSIFFGKLAGIPSGGAPYPVFAFAALVPWAYFAYVLSAASSSIVENRGLITKVYFPRLLLPLAPMLAGLVDFAIALGVLLVLMIAYGLRVPPTLVLLPVFLLLAMLSALALGLWLAALNAHYRDFRYVIPFILQVGLFASPIAYPSSLIRDDLWRALYGLNPMASVIEGFRWSLLGQGDAPGLMLWVSTGLVLLLLLTGLAVFRRMEATFVDVV